VNAEISREVRKLQEEFLKKEVVPGFVAETG
jgi:hypothetical protein